MTRSLLTDRSAAVIVVALLALSVVALPVAGASATQTTTADGDDVTSSTQTTAPANESADEDTFDVSLGDDRTVEIGDSLRLEPQVTGASGDVRYDWNEDVDGTYPRETDDESALSLGTMIVPGDYTVTVTATDESGHSVTDTVDITVASEFGDTEQIQSDKTMYGDDIDGVYALEAEEGDAVGMVAGGGMRQAILYDENAQPIRTITAGPDTVLQGTTAEYSGEYYLAITSDPDTYAELSGYTRSQESSEPNDGQSEAAEIPSDTTTTAILTQSDDSDWYAVEAGEGSLDVSAKLSVHALHQEDIQLQIYTEDGRQIGEIEPFEGGTTTNETYASGGGGIFEAEQSAEITDAGTYYIRVSRPSVDREYTVGFTEYKLTVDGTEVTDSAADAPTETETSVSESPSASQDSADASDPESTPTATATPTQTSSPSDSPTATDADTDTPTPESESTDDGADADTSSSESDSSADDADSDTSDSRSDSTGDADADTSSDSDSTGDADSGASNSQSDSSDDADAETPTPELTPTATPDVTQTPSSSGSPTTTEERTATTTQNATSEPTTDGEADTTAASTDGGSFVERIYRAIQSLIGRPA
ncbi:hypothetical protein SAMN04488063_3247 [Halopelagius inordinatus]|uniref:Pre-peptidase C-terminal domain-containing protein n=1 Tax=Halopelagius inordinatus TaxID=553467 RepID=A0A1I2VNF8_9EURY|nr:hypothetical protein [Halopelagius inordinatus]SFG90855.1 hypothetical protein SAMN04488063_3247 [Halopelagius inordinatus]